ncbi:hypothetical protein VC83_01570 [Pseudogymnoascus destructans]|uniref:Aminoglycoside phosphotransferase domain-containing protein n=2 Tax=Pseudogymnoascus destructans TaxID=655981 RepID=L8FWJ0_PSED2|nr:uncharacterized protein VC83_01570 [Pseudogymnoascus destructans]ELR05315.1 hypothetical protein GMDG_07298 [Pseudogymnoascus destructans 20631-21]OAF61713.1 hypothetical protein VC83_01570 [Pseudogymnoascus destructans]
MSPEELNGIISKYKGAIRVIKLSNDIAVKFGRGVTAAEARTHEFAYQNVNPNIVHVPQVYRFFERDYDPRWSSSEGYLFMEYVPGRTLAELDLDVGDDIVPRIAQIIAHLGQIGVRNDLSDAVPGPIGGGSPRGYQEAIFGVKMVREKPSHACQTSTLGSTNVSNCRGSR